ncbi:MAG: Gfo/Idh/MocA family oxidoreductase [Clostridia bacterium]|nr:Gfo/Idh/MocA family oxidoreductase [Clostridia bacterium]MBR4623731.1 Gfo/Idh/MocA family oxidoreductase [Clostridia bacterium]
MINFAVIGTNFITEYFLSAAKKCENFRLLGVHSRNVDKAHAFADKWDAEKIYTDYDVLASDREIDAVYIATPNGTHKNLALKMLNSKKHVIVEKSAAANSREWQEMITCAKNNGVVLLEALRTVYNPNYHLLQTLLPKLGTIRRVVLSCCSYSSRYDNFRNGIIENAFRPELANGALMDLGVYALSFLVGLFGAPKEIKASAIILKDSIDGVGSITCTYDTFLADVMYGKVSPASNICEIQGEEGFISITGMNAPTAITVKLRNGEIITPELESAPFPSDLIYEVRAFTDMVLKNDGSEDRQNLRTKQVLEIMDEARKQQGIIFPNDLKNV